MDVVLIGAGPVGLAAASAAVEDGAASRIMAIVDPDEAARSSASAHLGGTPLAAADQLPEANGACAIVTFSSRAETTAPLVRDLIDRRYHVVTTCEAMTSPPVELASGLDRVAKAAGRSIVATGANPGFVMDRLPVMIASASRNVSYVEVRRVVDTARRRESLVRKTGRGMTQEQFDQAAEDGRVGHVGLAESARQLASGLGWHVSDPVQETLDPLLEGSFVTGVHQTARLGEAGRSVVLDLTMAWEPSDPGDVIIVEGDPPVRLVVQGGFHGDDSTTALVVGAVRIIDSLQPGFHRPVDLPVSMRR